MPRARRANGRAGLGEGPRLGRQRLRPDHRPAAAAANVKATAAGAHHSLALKEDGSVVAWGHNGNGQTSVPAGLDEAQAIAGGANHSLALSVPAPPGGVDFFEAAPGDRRATLSWVNPTDADYSATRILRSTVGTASGPEPGGSQTQVYEGTAGSHTDTGLTNGQTYYYSAYARDDAGNWSPKAVARVTPADMTRPTVTGVSPASRATRVSIAANVLATFSEPMHPSTITRTTVRLVRRGTTSPIRAVVSYNASAMRATLNPSAALARGATYTATVTTGARDLAGNPLAATKSWSFTTRR